MIAIVQGCGANIASVQFAFARLGQEAVLTTDASTIRAASHVVLPGVGTAANAMAHLAQLGLVDVIKGLTQPVLGICLGMQLLYGRSEEGNVDCLGIVPGTIVPFPAQLKLVLPHMGWNQLALSAPSSLTHGVREGSHVYFVHGYVAPISCHTLASTHYGVSFSAMVQKDNFYGVQFHPERSHRCGEQILANFLSCTKNTHIGHLTRGLS